MSLLHTLLAAVLALVPDLGGVPGPVWDDLELPRGFVLDLETGLVSNRLPEGRPGLRFRAGALESGSGLRVLDAWEGGGLRARVERGAGDPVESVAAGRGLELTFELEERGWGYLRVLSVGSGRVALELALAPPEAPALERLPGRLGARSVPNGVELRWPAVAGERYRIERRVLATGDGFELAGETDSAPFLDGGAVPGRLYEYRVARAGGDSSFGARARGACAVLAPDEGIRVARGQTIDLLTGASHAERVDLTVEFVGNNGAHLGCGPGVRIRLLSDMERARWELEADSGDLYRDQRIFVNAERELGVILPEGAYVRLRVEGSPGGSTIVYRQIDLAGGRWFPPPPSPPVARWSPDKGVRFLDFPRPPAGNEAAFELALEREEGYLSDEWHEVARVALDEAELLDPTGARRGLVRYRYRTYFGGGAGLSDERRPQSIPGPPRIVLLGDDGGEESDALLERALGELASPEYELRVEAQGTLSALGPRAWPRLHELLQSEDPELVAAARDLLAGVSEKSEVAASSAAPPTEGAPALELAPMLLRARAEAAGLGEPPPGFLSADPDRRALALLRAPQELERDAFEAWRELIAVADPDPGLRLVAGAVGAWPSTGAGAAPRFTPGRGLGDEVPPFDLAELSSSLFDRAHVQEDVRGRLDPAAPWTAFVRLELLHALAAAEDSADAFELVALGESLLARHEADPTERTFLSAALALVDSPSARLRAGMDLARLRFARLQGPIGGVLGERRVVHLERADTQVLYDELEALRLADARDVDLVLPPGVYEPLQRQPSLTVGGQGLRLIGEGRVVLRSGLMVYRDADVVFESLVLAPETGTAINVDRGSVVLRDCYVDAPALAMQGNDSVLGLDRTEIVPRNAASGVAGGIRPGRFSMVLARDGRMSCPTGAISGAQFVYLERCVVDGGDREAISGNPEGELLVLDSYLRTRPGTVLGNSRGVLEGAILASEEPANRSPKSQLVVCPIHVALSGPAGDAEVSERAASCPLGR